MKHILTIVLTLALTKNVFAAVVDGNKALTLRSNLIAAGAEVKILTDASFVEVKNVKCHQEGGFVLLPMKCEFVDLSSGRLVEVVGAKANKLSKSLEDAGAKVISTRSGELSNYSVSAKSVNCGTSAVPRIVSCELVK